jgi:hypothetical protein
MNPIDSSPYHVERSIRLYTKGDRRYTQAKLSEVLEAASDICVDLGLPQDAVRLLAFSHMVAASEMRKEVMEAKERAKKIDDELARGPTEEEIERNFGAGRSYPAAFVEPKESEEVQ